MKEKNGVKNMTSSKNSWGIGCFCKLMAALCLVLVIAVGCSREVSAQANAYYDVPAGKTKTICLLKGESTRLYSKLRFWENIGWKSSNTNVVSVKNDSDFSACSITVKKAGTATVSATYQGKTYKARIYVGSHNWGKAVETRKATCTKKGKLTYTCTRCKKKKTESTPKVHSYKTVKTVAATKKHRGYDIVQCSICKKEKKDNFQDWQTTEEEVYACLMKMKEKYPQGTKWGVEEGECAAFATMLVYDAFGYLGEKYHWMEDSDRDARQDIENIRVGDVISTYGMGSGHLQVVQKILGKNKFLLAEGNYNRTVNWERVVSFKYNEKIGMYSYAGDIFQGYYTFYADLPDE